MDTATFIAALSIGAVGAVIIAWLIAEWVNRNTS
jgi:hypothetical protein